MTEVKHTPEPWYVEHPVSGEVEICRKFDAQCRPDRDEGAGFGSYLGVHIAGLPHQGDNPCVPLSRALANARRIVACVNACAGVPTEKLEHVCSVTTDPRKRLEYLVGAAEAAMERLPT